MARVIPLITAVMVGMLGLLAAAQQEPEFKCPGGLSNLINGFRTECDTVKIPDLHGHSATQIIYEIIMEADLGNDTFFENGRHVTCLFKKTSFALGGLHIGAGPFELTIPDFEADGTICLYVEDVPQGGLNLGEIRALTREFILQEGCKKCGWITANFLSGNETQEGVVRVDWRTNANCIENCIDPETDLAPQEDGGKDDEDDGNSAVVTYASYTMWLLSAAMATAFLL